MNDEMPNEPTEQLPTEPTERRPTEPTERQPKAEESRPRRLLRSRDDRMIAGVAGGLGRYFDVDPVIFRLAFAVSVFFGGLGALAYLALALFVPSAGAEGEESPAPIQRSRWLGLAAGTLLIVVAISSLGSLVFWGDGWGWGDGWHFGWLLFPVLVGIGLYLLLRGGGPGRPPSVGHAIGVVLLVILGVMALGAVGVASAYAGATGSGVVIASIVVAIGALLIIAAFRGGARWLIAPALALAIPLGAVAATDLSFASGVGEREYRPTTVTAIPDDGYELGIGRLAVDLRDIEWTKTTTVDLDLDLGIGQAVVAVPENVCVVSDSHVGAGDLRVLGQESDGADLDDNQFTGNTATPQLRFHGELDFGQLLVLNSDDVDLDHHFGPNSRDLEDTGDADLAAEACS
jgi:phage shock protein PspC (stress-responsive transcriptional regulator)